MLDLNDRVIMISGANRGIGQAVAENLLEAGCRLSLGVRNPDQVDEKLLASDQVLVCQYDAADPDGALQWVEQTIAQFGQLDGIVNNAGIYRAVSIEEGDEEDLDAMWEVNVKGPWRLMRAAFPRLKQSSQPRIINIISLSGKRLKSVGTTGYAMSKFAARALHQGCRQAGWDDGIRATAICTSFVKTDMASEVVSTCPEDVTRPEEVADNVRFLLSQPDHATINELHINCRLEPEY
ncbi:SDR family NAD(P)-dependent oxidoreductase [Endozoicomonadaceae bacterium StTr2]